MKGSILFLLALALGWAGCTTRMPLDAVVAPTAIRGQITVTVLNGISPTAQVGVQVVAPDGAIQTATSSSSVATLGQAVFSEPTAGRYVVSIANQPSQAPNSVPVTLTVAQPYASVNLQIGYGYLSVTASDGKGFNYDETGAFHSYTLTYVNPTNLQQDATVLYNAQASTLPPGWQVVFNSTVLKAGQSTQMLVQTAPWTIFGNATIVVSAVSSNSTPIFAAPVVLTQKWQPQIAVTYLTAACTNFWVYPYFFCGDCSNGGNTVQEQTTDVGVTSPSNPFASACSSSGAEILTAASTDTGASAIISNNICIGDNTLTFSTTFQSNKTYTFSLGGGCDNYTQYVTITPSMLQ